MRSLLTKIGLPKALGLYVEDDRVTLSQVVATPFGAVETAGYSEIVDPDRLPAVLERLIKPLVGGHGFRRVPLAVGVPARRAYFSTRPIQVTDSDPSPHVLLREALRCPNIPVNDMVVDVIKAQPDKRPVASIVSCDREYLQGLLDALKPCAVRPVRAEPGPCALLRIATGRYRAGRRAKLVLCLFLSESHVLAVLAAKAMPVAWRLSPLARGNEAASILSATRTMLTVGNDCGIQSPLDVVTVHGRPDLIRLLEVDWLEEQIGAPLKWSAEPSPDRSQVAFGLALGCLKEDRRGFDLARMLKPPTPLWELFPWRVAAVQMVLLLGLALVLFNRFHNLSGSYAAIQVRSSDRLWTASVPDSELQKEANDLKQRVAAVDKFLDGRIAWTSYQRALANDMPANVFLTTFQGVSELGAGGKKGGKAKPKKSLVLHGAVSVPQSGLVPHEVDRLLNTLREHPLLKQDFPLVELADLKQVPAKAGESPMAFFTVLCLPKSGKGGAK